MIKSSKEKANYVELKNTLKSIEFVHNLDILFDALTELSDLSDKHLSRYFEVCWTEFINGLLISLLKIEKC